MNGNKKNPSTYRQPPLLYPEGTCCFKAGEYEDSIPYYDCVHNVIPSFESDFMPTPRVGETWRHKLDHKCVVNIKEVIPLIRRDGHMSKAIRHGAFMVDVEVFSKMFELVCGDDHHWTVTKHDGKYLCFRCGETKEEGST